MVSAVCPNCHILLVEATSATDANLGAAVNTAVTLGAKYVSNSYGGGESSGQTSDDSSYYNHPGVAITASTGDDGNGAEYPATSQYVTAVGGTSLSTASNSRGWTETAWSGAGSGCSAYDAKPTWQTVTTELRPPGRGRCLRGRRPEHRRGRLPDLRRHRAGPSTAAPARPRRSSRRCTRWPARPAAGTYPASYPYAHPGNLFDVTSGSNGSCGAPTVHRRHGLGRPDRPRHAERHGAFTAGGASTVTVDQPRQPDGHGGHRDHAFTLTASGGTDLHLDGDRSAARPDHRLVHRDGLRHADHAPAPTR